MTPASIRLSARAELRLGGVLVALTAAAGALMADRMAGMDTGPSAAPGSLGWFVVSWTMMMAAMMLPALAPMIVEHEVV